VSEGALRLGLRLAAALEKNSVPYALGGALAYSIAGIPRTTFDVDVNVFVEPDQLDGVVRALGELGAPTDLAKARREAEEQGMFVAWADGMRIDVFTPSIDFSWEAQRTSRRCEALGQQASFLSPEALAVFKLMFFRSKDISDLERMVAVLPALDRAWVRKHIVEMMGEDDERTQTWDRLVREFASPQTGE